MTTQIIARPEAMVRWHGQERVVSVVKRKDYNGFPYILVRFQNGETTWLHESNLTYPAVQS